MNARIPDCSCSACLAEGKSIPLPEACPHGECPLSDVPDGTRTHVRELRGCRQLRSRLYSLGFTPGTEITMHGRGDAGCRVEVRDVCVVLDCDSAGSILCDETGSAVAARGNRPLRGLFHGYGRKGDEHD